MTNGAQYHSVSEKEMFSCGIEKQPVTDISDQEVKLCNLQNSSCVGEASRNHNMKRAKWTLSEDHFFLNIKTLWRKLDPKRRCCLALVTRKSTIQSWTHTRINQSPGSAQPQQVIFPPLMICFLIFHIKGFNHLTRQSSSSSHTRSTSTKRRMGLKLPHFV